MSCPLQLPLKVHGATTTGAIGTLLFSFNAELLFLGRQVSASGGTSVLLITLVIMLSLALLIGSAGLKYLNLPPLNHTILLLE